MSKPTPLKLMTWNLRYDSMPDGISVQDSIRALPKTIPADSEVRYYENWKEVPWSSRRIAVAEVVRAAGVDVLGVQEALKRQVLDLEELLGGGWGRVGVGRDDGVESGEYEAIFFRNTINLITWDTFWLSLTPFIPSKHPTAGSIRSTTFALFQTTTFPPKPFTLMCTHWDNVSDPQRRLAASLIKHRGAYESQQTNGAPVFVLGDFNSSAGGKDSGGYQIITGQIAPVDIDAGFKERFKLRQDGRPGFLFKDMANSTLTQRRSGHYATFTGFEKVGVVGAFARIDFVMGGSLGGWESEAYRVGDNVYDFGNYLSDHRPVYSDILLL